MANFEPGGESSCGAEGVQAAWDRKKKGENSEECTCEMVREANVDQMGLPLLKWRGIIKLE